MLFLFVNLVANDVNLFLSDVSMNFIKSNLFIINFIHNVLNSLTIIFFIALAIFGIYIIILWKQKIEKFEFTWMNKIAY